MDGVDDEWDESFLDELIRAHDEAVASRNPNPTPAPAPAHFDPFATAAALPLSHIAAAPHASASAARFSPPRELTQRPPPAGSDILALVPAVGRGFSPPRELSQRPAAEESDCEIVGVAGPAGGDRFRGGAMRREWDAREAERREVERLKKELNRVSKQMNDLKNECNELKKDRTKKDLEIKAKEAEIQKLKKANVKDICSMGMNIDQSFHTPANGALPAGGSCWMSTRRAEKSNGKNKELRSSQDGLCFNERPQTDASEVLELKHRTMTDSRTNASGEVSVEESAHLESKSASGKCKEIKTIRVQTDLPLNSEHLERKKVMLERISSNLCAIWGMPTNSLLGRNLISNILVSCSEDILQLLRSMRLPDGTSSEVSSSMNNDISEVYDIIIKMNSDTIPIQTLLEALLNLCAVGNAVVVGSALRMLHSILQHLLNYGAKSSQRNNVCIEPYVNNSMDTERSNHECSSTLLNTPDTENLLRSNDGLHIGNMFLPFTFWTSLFTAMLQIGVKHSEESIRIDALSIMILIVRTSDPKGVREKFGFTSVLESLHQLLQKENGLLVKRHSVQLLFLLLNSMLKLLCSGGKDGSEQMEAVGCENERPQQAISAVLKDLSEYLTSAATSSLELKLCRQVVILLAYIASSGKLGYEVLLGSVTACGANFLELITEVLASQMECEVDCSTEAQELLKERCLLMREALILLNRLASHANFSKPTLEVLTSSKLCATLTIDIANRLPQKSKYPLRHLGEINPQMANDLAELAQKFRSRVYGFLEEQHSTVDRSNLSASHKS